MDRKNFLTSGLIVGGATLVPSIPAFSQNLTDNNIDKLVDKDGNFVHQTLPYSNNHLEPYMDEETLYLHYTFHHGGAVKAANKDLQMIKKAMDDNSLETVDFWTKKLSYHLSSHILHSVFWTNLNNKKTDPGCIQRFASPMFKTILHKGQQQQGRNVKIFGIGGQVKVDIHLVVVADLFQHDIILQQLQFL